MTSSETVTLTREEYARLLERQADLEDALAALDADDGSRIPHAVAQTIIRGESPAFAYRKHRGLTLQELSSMTGLSVSYLSQIERGRKPGSVAALTRIATILGASIDVLVTE